MSKSESKIDTNPIEESEKADSRREEREYNQRNRDYIRTLEQSEYDLDYIKGLGQKEKFQDENFLQYIQELLDKSDFIEKSFKELSRSESFLDGLEKISEFSDLNIDDILDILQKKEDVIIAKARSQILGAKNKWLKFGKIAAYAGVSFLAASTTLGLGGIIGVAVARNVEKYISNKSDDKKINKRAQEIKKNLDLNSFAQDISASMFLSKNKMLSESFLNQDISEISIKIDDFINIKYRDNIDSDLKLKLRTKYFLELEAEKRNLELEKRVKKDKVSNFLNIINKNFSEIKKYKGRSIENKAINSAIFSAGIISLGYAGRSTESGRLILGGLLGWNLGGILAEKMVKNISSKEIEKNNINKIDQKMEEVKSGIREIVDYYEKQEYEIDDDEERERKSAYIFNFKIHTSEKLEELKKDLANYSIRIEKLNSKNENPQELIALQDRVRDLKKYFALNMATFSAFNFNESKELASLVLKDEQVIINLKKFIFKLSGALIGLVSYELVESLLKKTDQKNLNDDFNTDNTKNNNNNDFIKTDYSDQIIDDSINLEYLKDGGIDVDDLSNSAMERIKLIGPMQKVVTLNPGEGVSKIFNGYLDVNDPVNFIDGKTGDVIKSTSANQVVNPGDQVVLSEEGKIYVICKRGVVDFSNQDVSLDQQPIIEASKPIEEMPTIKVKRIPIDFSGEDLSNVSNYDNTSSGIETVRIENSLDTPDNKSVDINSQDIRSAETSPKSSKISIDEQEDAAWDKMMSEPPITVKIDESGNLIGVKEGQKVDIESESDINLVSQEQEDAAWDKMMSEPPITVKIDESGNLIGVKEGQESISEVDPVLEDNSENEDLSINENFSNTITDQEIIPETDQEIIPEQKINEELVVFNDDSVDSVNKLMIDEDGNIISIDENNILSSEVNSLSVDESINDKVAVDSESIDDKIVSEPDQENINSNKDQEFNESGDEATSEVVSRSSFESNIQALGGDPSDSNSFKDLIGSKFLEDNNLSAEGAQDEFGRRSINIMDSDGSGLEIEFKLSENGNMRAEIRDIFNNQNTSLELEGESVVNLNEEEDIAVLKKRILSMLNE